MAKIRIYELARELNMENKDLLQKMQAMDIEVKNHMSSLDEALVSRIKNELFGKKEKTEIVEDKRIKPNLIRRRKRRAPLEPEKPEPVMAAEEAEASAVPEAETVAEAKKEEKGPETVAAEGEEVPEKVEASIAPREVEPEEAAPAVAPEKKKPEKKPVKAKPKPKAKKSAPAKVISLPEKPEPEAEEPPAEPLPGEPVLKPVPAEPEEEDFVKKKAKKKKALDLEKGRRVSKIKVALRRKEVIEGEALYDRAAGRGRKGRKKIKSAPAPAQKTQITMPKAIKRRIRIDDTIMLADLAKRMGVKANEVIAKLMGLGMMLTVNQTIDFDTAGLIAPEFGFEVEKAAFEETEVIKIEVDDPAQLVSRPPVVTIMGHVDHGKTSILDVIRRTKVTELEIGGITQKIGAYHVQLEKGDIVFLDTPGHEAFTAMRARGAHVTDIVVLVVAADDGVMPQTIEAIDHAKAAGVPIVVAVNKIDKDGADPERVKRELAEKGLVPEDWGGDTIFVEVSAKQQVGIDGLLEMILLQAEVLELKANPNKPARGHVIESRMDKGRGAVATVLIREGTLRIGAPVVCGMYFGKVRIMFNDRGEQVKSAGPSIPVEIVGLSGVPMAGDEFVVLADEKNAKQVSQHRMEKQRAQNLSGISRMSLEKLYEQMQEGGMKDLNLIIKADVQGSIEALRDSLIKLSSDEVKINVIHAAVGPIHESDVSLAAVSNAIILGFYVRPSAKVASLAEEANVDIRYYDVIYNAIKDVQDAMLGMMESKYEEQVLGQAEVRQVFMVPHVGAIAGCYVTNGKIVRNMPVRLIREGVVSYDGKIASLKRFKDDAKEVHQNYECGINIENYNDIKVGDIIESYYLEEIKPVAP